MTDLEDPARTKRLLDIGVRSVPHTKPWSHELEAAFRAEMLKQANNAGNASGRDLASQRDQGPHQGASTAAAPLSLVFVHSESRVATVVRVRFEPMSQHGVGVARHITWLSVNAGGQRGHGRLGHAACRPLLRVVAPGASRRLGTTSWWPTAVVVCVGRPSTARWSAAVAACFGLCTVANSRGTPGTMARGLCGIFHPLLVWLVCVQAGGVGKATHTVVPVRPVLLCALWWQRVLDGVAGV